MSEYDDGKHGSHPGENAPRGYNWHAYWQGHAEASTSRKRKPDYNPFAANPEDQTELEQPQRQARSPKDGDITEELLGLALGIPFIILLIAYPWPVLISIALGITAYTVYILTRKN